MKDEKGYVMSGIALLLLIPVMIMIPLVLSVQNQSSNIPESFVRSDVVGDSFNTIANDLNTNVQNFANNVHNKNFTSSNNMTNLISNLYNLTSAEKYKNAYINLDLVTLSPRTAPRETLQMNNQSGVIPLKNGITIKYVYDQSNSTTQIHYYNLTVVVNTTLSVKKDDTGQQNTITDVYGTYIFSIPYNTNTNTFFSEIENQLIILQICLT